jgi:hypothetical protein
MERLSVRRKRRERRIGSVGVVAHLAEPRRWRILLPEGGAAAVGRECGRNVGPWVYLVGRRDVKRRFKIRRKVPRCRNIVLRLRPIQ